MRTRSRSRCSAVPSMALARRATPISASRAPRTWGTGSISWRAVLKKVPTHELVDELFKEIDRYYAAGKTVERDERKAAEAREWLAANEDAEAMTPEKLAALEAAAAEQESEADAVLESMLEPAGVTLDESASPVAGRRFSRN